jgi:hypothetical protein
MEIVATIVEETQIGAQKKIRLLMCNKSQPPLRANPEKRRPASIFDCLHAAHNRGDSATCP